MIMLVRFALFGLILSLQTSANIQQPPAKAPAPDNFRVSIVLQQLNSDPAFFHSAQLTPADERAAGPIIADFVRLFLAYAKGVDRHEISPNEFFEIRDDLIERARRKFEKTLTKAGGSRLKTFINEKAEQLRITPNVRPRGPQVLV